MSNIAIWTLPTHTSARSDLDFAKRTHHYRFEMSHQLNDGTKVIPKVTTVIHILNSFDQFKLPVAISHDSYDELNQ